jgi:hypothetical protein
MALLFAMPNCQKYRACQKLRDTNGKNLIKKMQKTIFNAKCS